MSHQPKGSKKKTRVSVMTGNKSKGKTWQGGAKARSYSDPSNIGPSISPQRQRKGKHATVPIGQVKKGRLEHESAQDEKAIVTPNSFTESTQPWKAVRDVTSFGGMKSVSPNTGNRTSGSSTDGLGHPPFLQPFDADVDCVPVKAKLLRRFYEPLVLLHVLDPSRGSRIPRYTGDVECEEEELRRSFIDSVAYICDYKKGGDTVTAAAMQKEPAGVTIWLAANTTIQVKTLGYLHDVLDCLAAITTSNRASTEDILAVRIIDFNKKRLQAYKTFVRPALQKCLEMLEKARSRLVSSEDLSQTSAWLEGFADLVHTKDGDLYKLVQQCFTVRTKTPFRVISHLAMSEESGFAYSDLRHYIGRLGGHLKAIRILVSTALATPSLLDNFSIKVRRSSRTMPSPLASGRINLNGIIGRAFHTKEDIAHYHALITSMDRIVDGGLQRGVRDSCSFSTRVHAELLLVDLFQEHGFDFVADDRYIGCSKPACYCCYHYISALRGGFSLSMPACHNNLYLPWRAPDILTSRGAAPVKMRENALNTMIISVRADLKRQLDSQAPRRSSQFDSLTGVTSVRERELPGGRDVELTFPERVEPHSDDESIDIRSRSSSVDSSEELREELPTEHMVDAFQLSQDTTDSGLALGSSEDSDSGGVWLHQSL